MLAGAGGWFQHPGRGDLDVARGCMRWQRDRLQNGGLPDPHKGRGKSLGGESPRVAQGVACRGGGYVQVALSATTLLANVKLHLIFLATAKGLGAPRGRAPAGAERQSRVVAESKNASMILRLMGLGSAPSCPNLCCAAMGGAAFFPAPGEEEDGAMEPARRA